MMQKILEGGTATQVIGVSGALAVLLGLLGLLVILIDGRSTVLRGLAILCLLAADIAAGAGAAGSWLARQRVDAEAATLTPAKAEHARYQGYIDAGSTSGLAVPLAGAALVLAAMALQVAGKRRWTEEHDSPPLGPALPGLLVLAGFALSAAGVYFWQGHRLSRPMDESAWRVLELRDALAAQTWTACLSTDLKLEAGSLGSEMRELRKIQSECAKHFLAASAEKGGGRGDLEKLLTARWFDNGDERRNVQQRLDEMAASERKIAKLAAIDQEKPPPPPDPALARVHAAALACYAKSGRSGSQRPSMPSSLHLVVSREGRIIDAKPKDGGKQNSRTQKCVAKALKDISFQSGVERALDVPL